MFIESAVGLQQVARQYDRVRRTAQLSRLVGARGVAKVVGERFLQTGSCGDLMVDIPPAVSGLLRPFRLEATPHDLSNYDEIVSRRVYELPDRLAGTVQGKNIVDVGAYIGLSMAYFATKYPRSKVIAVEPLARNHDLLHLNACRYGDTRAVAVYGGLAPDETPLATASRNPGLKKYMANAFGPELPDKPDCAVPPPALTAQDILNQLTTDKIGILKVDIEGAERALFGSATIQPLLERTGVLLAETHDSFMPGASEAVDVAARHSGLQPAGTIAGHTLIYAR